MNEYLTDVLIADHRRIRALGAEQQAEVERNAISEARCFELFRRFSLMVNSHNRAEEAVLYEYLKKKPCSAIKSVCERVLDGFEEHDLIGFLLKEMSDEKQVTPEWCAKLRVILELLDHHFKLEEEKLLPAARQIVSPEDCRSLARSYIQARDEVLLKKRSGSDRTAPNSEAVNLSH